MFTNTPLYNPKIERDTFLNITSNEQEYEIIIIIIVLHKKMKGRKYLPSSHAILDFLYISAAQLKRRTPDKTG